MILRANDSCRGDKTNVSPDIVVPASDGGKVAVGAVRLAPRSGGDTGRPRSRPGMIGLPSFVTMLMLLLLLLLSEQCVSGQRLLVDVHDSISEADMNVDGACVDGCTRQVVEGVGAGSGETDCDLRVLNLLDHVDGDVQGGTLSIVHSCTDSSNSLRYQGVGDCQYEVCAEATWEDGLLTYSIGVTHEKPVAEYDVRVQVYLNLDSDSTSTSSSSVCTMGDGCSDFSDPRCSSDEAEVTILLKDDGGDGWIGALSGRENLYTLTKSGSNIANGTLAKGLFSQSTKMCLGEGAYTFTTTANAAWSSESTWSLDECGTSGGAGGSFEFQVYEGECSTVDDSNADGPPDATAVRDEDDYCTLPSETACVDLDDGFDEVSGPSVGMYYDETCLEGGDGVTGCGGGGVQACRLCFINTETFLLDFPNNRYPDWTICPCCVAEAAGTACQEGFMETPPPVPGPSILEEIEAYYWEGGLPVMGGLSGVTALCLLCACCLGCSISKDKSRIAHAYKVRSTAMYAGYGNSGDTSPDTTPPLHHGVSNSSPRDVDPRAPPTADPKAALWVPDGKMSDGSFGNKSRKKSGSRDLSATMGGMDMEAGNVVGVAPHSSAQSGNTGGNNRRSRGASMGRGDRASEDQSDRWSGGSDATAFMEIGAYDHVRNESCEIIAEPVGLEEYQGMVKNRGPKSMMQALKSVGSRRSTSTANDDGLEGWVERPLPPSPDRNAPVPVKVTVVPAGESRRGYSGDRVNGTALPRRRENREQRQSRSRSPINPSREQRPPRDRREEGGGSGHRNGLDARGSERHRNERPRGRDDRERQRSRSPKDQGRGDGRGTQHGGRRDGGQGRSREPPRQNARGGDGRRPADGERIVLSNDRHRMSGNNDYHQGRQYDEQEHIDSGRRDAHRQRGGTSRGHQERGRSEDRRGAPVKGGDQRRNASRGHPRGDDHPPSYDAMVGAPVARHNDEPRRRSDREVRGGDGSSNRRGRSESRRDAPSAGRGVSEDGHQRSQSSTRGTSGPRRVQVNRPREDQHQQQAQHTRGDGGRSRSRGRGGADQRSRSTDPRGRYHEDGQPRSRKYENSR